MRKIIIGYQYNPQKYAILHSKQDYIIRIEWNFITHILVIWRVGNFSEGLSFFWESHFSLKYFVNFIVFYVGTHLCSRHFFMIELVHLIKHQKIYASEVLLIVFTQILKYYRLLLNNGHILKRVL